MSFPRYPKYKNGGVEWLGEVPEHWEIGPLRRSIEFLTDYEANGSFADTKENVAIDTGEPYAWYVRATDLEQRRFGLAEGNRFCDQATFNWLTKTSLRGGELLVAKRGEIGKVYVMPTYGGNATLAPNLYLIRLTQDLQPRYAWYWFSVDPGRAELVLADKSTTIGALYKDDVKSCLVATPSTSEQMRIVEFLDRETGKIDELVAEQQRLMELLKEKRQAVISHAVTKGLNPHAPMKPSGIEWLGDVPEHWETRAFRRVISAPLSNGIFKKNEDFGEGTLLVNVFDVYRPDFKVNFDLLDRVRCSADEVLAYQVHPDDLFFVRSSLKREGIGVVAIAGVHFEPVVYECHLIRARLRMDLLNGRFASYVLNSSVYRSELIAKAKVTTMTTIDQEAILSTRLPVPPLAEQKAIVVYVEAETAQLDALAAEAQKAIDLLQERRTALISAAVTGQIDVRKLAAA